MFVDDPSEKGPQPNRYTVLNNSRGLTVPRQGETEKTRARLFTVPPRRVSNRLPANSDVTERVQWARCPTKITGGRCATNIVYRESVLAIIIAGVYADEFFIGGAERSRDTVRISHASRRD